MSSLRYTTPSNDKELITFMDALGIKTFLHMAQTRNWQTGEINTQLAYECILASDVVEGKQLPEKWLIPAVPKVYLPHMLPLRFDGPEIVPDTDTPMWFRQLTKDVTELFADHQPPTDWHEPYGVLYAVGDYLATQGYERTITALTLYAWHLIRPQLPTSLTSTQMTRVLTTCAAYATVLQDAGEHFADIIVRDIPLPELRQLRVKNVPYTLIEDMYPVQKHLTQFAV